MVGETRMIGLLGMLAALTVAAGCGDVAENTQIGCPEIEALAIGAPSNSTFRHGFAGLISHSHISQNGVQRPYSNGVVHVIAGISATLCESADCTTTLTELFIETDEDGIVRFQTDFIFGPPFLSVPGGTVEDHILLTFPGSDQSCTVEYSLVST